MSTEATTTEHHHDNAKQTSALKELIKRFAARSGSHVNSEQARAIARGLTTHVDLAGKGSLTALKKAIVNGADDQELLKALEPIKKWVAEMQEAGAYVGEDDSDQILINCAGEICC